MCNAQVRNVHKNEDMARYYRLKDKVRRTSSTLCATPSVLERAERPVCSFVCCVLRLG
jgi:hypothetical protein